MNEAHPPAAPPRAPPSTTLAADVLRAERLLFHLAGELRRVPIHSSVRLHLRALQIKRSVMRWNEQSPDEAARRGVIDELVALRLEVETLRNDARVPEGCVLATAG